MAKENKNNFYQLYAPFFANRRQLANDLQGTTEAILPQAAEELDNVVAHYALDGFNQPIGISEYQLSKLYPKDFKSSLPTIEEIEIELKG